MLISAPFPSRTSFSSDRLPLSAARSHLRPHLPRLLNSGLRVRDPGHARRQLHNIQQAVRAVVGVRRAVTAPGAHARHGRDGSLTRELRTMVRACRRRCARYNVYSYRRKGESSSCSPFHQLGATATCISTVPSRQLLAVEGHVIVCRYMPTMCAGHGLARWWAERHLVRVLTYSFLGLRTGFEIRSCTSSLPSRNTTATSPESSSRGSGHTYSECAQSRPTCRYNAYTSCPRQHHPQSRRWTDAHINSQHPARTSLSTQQCQSEGCQKRTPARCTPRQRGSPRAPYPPVHQRRGHIGIHIRTLTPIPMRVGTPTPIGIQVRDL